MDKVRKPSNSVRTFCIYIYLFTFNMTTHIKEGVTVLGGRSSNLALAPFPTATSKALLN
jgi:hypothetical protein